MITPVMRLFCLGLERVLDLARKGELELTDDELLMAMRGMALEPLSKEQAARYLNMRRSNFDTHVEKGHLPKGKKVVGFKELRWYKQELDAYAANLRRK
jgi:predicted DNA-binding transcriptional regulator AlpA